MDEDGADEVAKLADTLADGGFGCAAELGGMTRHHLLIAGMVRVFGDTRGLLTSELPFAMLDLLGRS